MIETGRTQVAALIVAIAACGAYAATLYPSIAGGDSAELVAAAAATGVPHPPGYPLYALLTAPFTRLPWLSPAGGANLASAICAAAAAGTLAWAAARVTNRWWAGAAAGGAFAFSPGVWLYAVGAEVFSLNNLLIAIQLALFVAADRSRNARLPYAGAVVFGLGLANHHTSIVFNGILLGGMMWRTKNAWTSPRRLALLGACAAAGLLPYVYLPLASARHPRIEWGDTSTLNGFITHLLRRDYGTFQLGSGPSASYLPLADQLGYYARDLVRQVSWIGIALAALGLLRGVTTPSTRVVSTVTLAAYATFLVAFHSLANLPLDRPLIHGVVARFWLAPNLIVCLWAAMGLAALTWLPPRVLAVGAIGLAVTQGALHAQSASQRGNVILHDYGSSVLNAAPRDALVLMRGDLITNTSRYLHAIEGVRPDLRLIDVEMLTFRWLPVQISRQMPDLVIPGTHYSVTDAGGFTIAQLVEANIAHRAVVACGEPKPGDSSLEQAYRRLPLGLCDRLVPLATLVDMRAWAAENEAAMPVFRNDMRRVPPADSWELVAWTDYWEARHRRALTLLTVAIERGDDPALLREGAVTFDRLVEGHPAPPAYYYKNLGITRARLAATDPTSVAPAIDAFRTYLRTAPAGDPQLAAISLTVHELEARLPRR